MENPRGRQSNAKVEKIEMNDTVLQETCFHAGEKLGPKRCLTNEKKGARNKERREIEGVIQSQSTSIEEGWERGASN